MIRCCRAKMCLNVHSLYFPEGCYKEGVEYTGDTIRTKNGVESAEDCHQECYDSELCHYWSYDMTVKACNLKGKEGESGRQKNGNFVSGPRQCERMNHRDDTNL